MARTTLTKTRWALSFCLSAGLVLACGSGDGSDSASQPSGGADRDDEASSQDDPGSPGQEGSATDDDDSSSSGSPGTGSTSPANCDSPEPGESPLRRLTNTEYRQTLSDLLGDAALVESVTRSLPREPTSLGFRTGASSLTVTPLIADVYTQVAQELGRALVADGDAIDCDPDDASPTCVQDFVETFGKQVYRRPLSNSELSRYAELYETLQDETGNSRTTLEWIAASMLSSPNFLFRVELSSAPGGGVSRPTDYEMATRLSYLLWQTMPDAELFAAADAGELTTREGIEEQVLRMLEDPKAFSIYDFFEQWLDLDETEELTRSEATYPEFDDELRQLLQTETFSFVSHLLTSDGTFADLIAADYTFANRALAEHYGLGELPAGAKFERVETPNRAGVLTQATMLMHDRPLRTSIVSRGLKIRTDFLCQIVPAPPDDVDTTLPELDGELTQRQRLEQHRADPSCAGCHALMDPIGEIFESFDALGRERDVDEAGASIVRGGTITATRTLDGDYESAADLAAAMAASDEVRECFTLQAFRYFYGRDASAADACTQTQLMNSFKRNDYRLIDLILGLTRSDQFLYRASSEGDAR